MALFGRRTVAGLAAKRDVKGLVQVIRDQGYDDANAYTVFEAGNALRAIGDTRDARAVEPLIAALEDQNKNVRHAAVGALGSIGDTRAVEPLIAALKCQDKFTRRDAATALGSIGDTRAVGPLTAALKDEEAHVRSEAATALASIEAKG